MIDFLLTVLVCLISIPVVYLVIQLFLATRGSREFSVDKSADLSDVIVVVPAHDEESVIETTLVSLISELPSSNQVLVVADNCTDGTVAIASRYGVEVIERKHDTKRGKGFALEYGVEYLFSQTNCPEHVIFVDADCLVKQGSLNALIDKCVKSGRPTQALYLMKTRGAASSQQKMADFAWLVKNWVRPLGLLNLGLPCQLMGTGMAFPFELLKQLKLGSANIVEDMKLGLDCASIGYPPVFCPDALIESYFPEDKLSIKNQRARWEHGHLGMIFSETSGLVKLAFTRRDKNSLAMVLDLLIPPQALLILVLIVMIIFVSVVFWLFNQGLIALIILISISFLLATALILSWYRFGRGIISLRELLWVPVYVIAKIPLYVRYWVRRETEWIRTGRD